MSQDPSVAGADTGSSTNLLGAPDAPAVAEPLSVAAAAEPPAPLLLRLRSGKTAAAVIAFGFGGGTLVMGGATAAASAGTGGPIFAALLGYGIAILPLLALAAIVAVCKSELWLLPKERSLRMLTYRPWRMRPRVEEAPLSEYAGVRTSKLKEEDGKGTLVSLVTASGEDVPLRQFGDDTEAHAYAEKLGKAAGFWVRAADESSAAPA